MFNSTITMLLENTEKQLDTYLANTNSQIQEILALISMKLSQEEI